jgi:hypothetical protein
VDSEEVLLSKRRSQVSIRQRSEPPFAFPQRLHCPGGLTKHITAYEDPSLLVHMGTSASDRHNIGKLDHSAHLVMIDVRHNGFFDASVCVRVSCNECPSSR